VTLTSHDVLSFATVEGARACHLDHKVGSLAEGKQADLVVLNGDYLAVPDEELDRLQPIMTIVGGEVVFEDTRATN
jgi:predicted amidohydrolase YtcJ